MIRAAASRFPETKNRKYTLSFSVSLSCLAIKYVVFVRSLSVQGRREEGERPNSMEHPKYFSAITMLEVEKQQWQTGDSAAEYTVKECFS